MNNITSNSNINLLINNELEEEDIEATGILQALLLESMEVEPPSDEGEPKEAQELNTFTQISSEEQSSMNSLCNQVFCEIFGLNHVTNKRWEISEFQNAINQLIKDLTDLDDCFTYEKNYSEKQYINNFITCLNINFIARLNYNAENKDATYKSPLLIEIYKNKCIEHLAIQLFRMSLADQKNFQILTTALNACALGEPLLKLTNMLICLNLNPPKESVLLGIIDESLSKNLVSIALEVTGLVQQEQVKTNIIRLIFNNYTVNKNELNKMLQLIEVMSSENHKRDFLFLVSNLNQLQLEQIDNILELVESMQNQTSQFVILKNLCTSNTLNENQLNKILELTQPLQNENNRTVIFCSICKNQMLNQMQIDIISEFAQLIQNQASKNHLLSLVERNLTNLLSPIDEDEDIT